MPCLRILYAVFAVMLFLPFFGKAVYAGCPAFPPEERQITVQECRFYDAAEDAELKKKVEQHFADWRDESAAQILSYKNAVYERNTGAIVTASEPGGGRLSLFYRSAVPDVCATFPVGEMQTVFTVGTCAMVFFAAPTALVIVPAPPISERFYHMAPTQPEELK